MADTVFLPISGGIADSPMEYFQRSGLVPIRRAKAGRIEPRELKLNNLPLSDPLPTFAYLEYLEGTPPGDRVATTDWPDPES